MQTDKEQCAYELQCLLDEGVDDMQLFFDACLDYDPAEIIEMLY